MMVKLFLKDQNQEISFLKDIILPIPPAEKAVVFLDKSRAYVVNNVAWHLDGTEAYVTVILR